MIVPVPDSVSSKNLPSFVVQASLSIFWTLIAMALMIITLLVRYVPVISIDRLAEEENLPEAEHKEAGA